MAIKGALILDEDNGQIAVQFPYDATTKDLLKYIYQAQWRPFKDRKGGQWIVDAKFADKIETELQNTPFNIIKTASFQTLLKGLEKPSQNDDEIAKIKEIKTQEDAVYDNPNFHRELYPFQRVGVNFLRHAEGRAIIADSPGLGKTTSCLAYLAECGGKTIVVSPANAKYVWAKELDATQPDKKYYVLSGRKKPEEDLSQYDVLIINYDILSYHVTHLKELNWENMVCDEAHALKNIRAKRTKAALKLSASMKRVLLLTGTPMINTAVDLYPLLHMIDPHTYYNWRAFAEEYGDPKDIRVKFNGRLTTRRVYNGASNLLELKERLAPIMIRRRKEDVLEDLPSKTRSIIPLELPTAAMKEYKAMKKDFIKWLIDQGRMDDAIKANRAKALTLMTSLKQVILDHKLDTAKEMIDELINDGRKVVLFSNFTKPLDELKQHYGDQAILARGGLSEKQRRSLEHDFQNNKEKTIFLGQLQATCEALTLTAADTAIFYDLSWSPKDHAQAEDRIHRIGTQYPVSIYYLITKNTIEEKIYQALLHKMFNISVAIDGQFNNIEKDDDLLKEAMKEFYQEHAQYETS